MAQMTKKQVFIQLDEDEEDNDDFKEDSKQE